MIIKPVDMYGQVELEILRQQRKIYGFNLLAKETASAEIKEFCGRLSNKWHNNKVKITIIEKSLVIHHPEDTFKNCLKVGLTEKDATALKELLSRGFEVNPTHHKVKDGRFGLQVIATSKK